MMPSTQDSLITKRRQLLMDRSVAGRIGTTLPAIDVPKNKLPPTDLLREDLTFPEVSEPELVRYFFTT